MHHAPLRTAALRDPMCITDIRRHFLLYVQAVFVIELQIMWACQFSHIVATKNLPTAAESCQSHFDCQGGSRRPMGMLTMGKSCGGTAKGIVDLTSQGHHASMQSQPMHMSLSAMHPCSMRTIQAASDRQDRWGE